MARLSPADAVLPPIPFGESIAETSTSVRDYQERIARVVSNLRSYEPLGNPTEFRERSCVVTSGGLRMIASANTPLAVEVGESTQTFLMIPFHGSTTFWLEHYRSAWAEGEYAAYLPSLGSAGGSATGDVRSSLILELDPERISATAHAMTGRPHDPAPVLRLEEPQGLALRLGRHSFDASLRELCRTVDACLGDPRALDLEGVDDAFYRTVVTMLAPQRFLDAPGRWRLTAGGVSVRRACEYMEVHLTEPITLTQLEQASGVQARALQLAFQRQLGCTPLEWLRARRLELARVRLLSAPPAATVAATALACGFTKVSDFSRWYAARYGEKPSTTLARSLRH